MKETLDGTTLVQLASIADHPKAYYDTLRGALTASETRGKFDIPNSWMFYVDVVVTFLEQT